MLRSPTGRFGVSYNGARVVSKQASRVEEMFRLSLFCSLSLGKHSQRNTNKQRV